MIVARRESRIVLPKTLPSRSPDGAADVRIGPARPAQAEARSPCQAASTGVAAVLGEERLLERRLAADEVEELVARRPRGRPA